MKRGSRCTSEDLPAPPVPVMPSTGVFTALAAAAVRPVRIARMDLSWAMRRHRSMVIVAISMCFSTL